MSKQPIILVLAIVIVLGLTFSLQSLLAAWQAPTMDPPDGDFWDLLHSGITPQGKDGPLLVNGVAGAPIGLRVENGNLVVNAGNVGIGTESPGAKLEVSGNGWTGLNLASTDSQGSFLNFGDSADPDVGRIYYSHVVNLMGFYTNDTQKMVIDSAGNVGIGTNNPQTTLDVNGKVRSLGTEATDADEVLATKGYVDSNGGVPTGAVMAFNATVCPTGWSEFTDARGRVVVGLDPSNASFDFLGEQGGEEAHPLSIEEMPEHFHTYTFRRSVSQSYSSYSWHENDWILENQTRDTSSVGGNLPHNNLQPYIALIYCVKN